MYLIDTNVISELRKRNRADRGVRAFFQGLLENEDEAIYLSVITIGELRRGVELIRHRGDLAQAGALESWLGIVLEHYAGQVLDVTVEEAQVWAKLRTPNHENAIDKLIAATALTHGLTLVTRNSGHFEGRGLKVINPFGA